MAAATVLDAADRDTPLERLARRARTDADRAAFHFDGRERSFAELWHEIERFARAVAASGVERGEPVVLALPNGPDFFTGFYGVQLAGGIAVPSFPGSSVDRLAGIARRCGARTLVLPSDLDPDARAAAAVETTLRLLTTDAAATGAHPPSLPRVGGDDPAYLQYTSGTTGDPKGVEITHAQVGVNVRQMIDGMEITADEVFVSWLPTYHDMGLVLMTMVPFHLAARLYLMPASLRQIRTWLDTIARRRGTFTAAPDFAYRLCLRQITDPGAYDLGSLRVALNAAEPVRHSTIEAFEKAFGLRHVMVPGYGLAEATVGVSMAPPGEPPAIDERGFVSVGPPFPQVELAILGDRAPADPGENGEVLVRSPANTRGYWRDPEATAELFWGDGYVHTGDIGHLDERGRLYIVGRSKNLILAAGRNLSPKEIEELVDELEFVRFSAAVGIDRGDAAGEQAYVFVELRAATPPARAECSRAVVAIVDRLHRALGVRPARVYLVGPRTIPRTRNGKIRYGELRRRYRDGRLRREQRIVFPEY